MSLASTRTIDPGAGVEVATDAVARALEGGADAAEVTNTYSELFEVNFDTRDVTLVRSTVLDATTITVYRDTRKGTAQLNGRSHDLVRGAIGQALDAADAAAPDPANVVAPGPGDAATDRGHLEPDREALVDAAVAHVRAMRTAHPRLLTESSNLSFRSTWRSFANSAGRLQSDRSGVYSVELLVAGKDGDQATSFSYTDVVAAEPMGDLLELPAVQRLMANVEGSFDPRPVPATFTGDVIFTPEALPTLLSAVAGALGGYALLRKTTPYLDAQGTLIADPRFSLLHRPSELIGSTPFDASGWANRDLDVIRSGVLEDFLVDWYVANKLDRPMTTGLTDFVVPAGDVPLEDLVAGTERGIVLGRFSGGLPNPNLDFSGVAKGSFYVEGGRILHPLSETMIAGNFAACLNRLRAISLETVEFGATRFPWLATSGITISTR